LVGRGLSPDCRLREAERLRDIFQRQLQLIRIEPFRTRPVAVAHQRAQSVAFALHPRYCAGPFFEQRHHGSQPRLEQGRIL
jgi:hypothetical protein